MIVLTGATGAFGGVVADTLLQTVDPAELVVVARDPAKAARFAERGVAVRHGDYADPATLPAAFAGADALLLVSTSDPHADARVLHGAAVDAAVQAGVGRVFYTSHQGAAPDTSFGPGRDHWATEQLLAASGLAWTSLRNGFYLHSLAWLTGPWRDTGVVSVPVDGPVSWTARSDAAVGAAALLLSPPETSGPVTLTAEAAPTFADVAEIASAVAGRPIAFETLGVQPWLDAQGAAGAPPFRSQMTLGMYEAAARGFFAGTDPLLTRLLGRPPRSVRDELTGTA